MVRGPEMIRPPGFLRTTRQAKPSSLKARCQNQNTLTAISKRERWKKKPASPPPTETPIFMVNWATAIRMKCLKIPTAIFPSRAQIRSTAENIGRRFFRTPPPECGGSHQPVPAQPILVSWPWFSSFQFRPLSSLNSVRKCITLSERNSSLVRNMMVLS
jgi:hypothetical protein